jgi:hypothetical protein
LLSLSEGSVEAVEGDFCFNGCDILAAKLEGAGSLAEVFRVEDPAVEQDV